MPTISALKLIGMSTLVAGVLLLSFSVSRAEDFGERYTLCKLQKEVRTLRVQMPTESGGKCTTTYNKYGKDQSVGEGLYPKSCEDILERVKTNLEESGWKCREVKNSSVSNLNEESP